VRDASRRAKSIDRPTADRRLIAVPGSKRAPGAGPAAVARARDACKRTPRGRLPRRIDRRERATRVGRGRNVQTSGNLALRGSGVGRVVHAAHDAAIIACAPRRSL